MDSISSPTSFIHSLNSSKHHSFHQISVNQSQFHTKPQNFCRRFSTSLMYPPTESKLRSLISEFKSLPAPIDRVKRLLHYASLLPDFDDSDKVDGSRVAVCSAQVWLVASIDDKGRMRFSADSDSEITRGFCCCLLQVLDGATPDEVLGVKADDLTPLSISDQPGINLWRNVLNSVHRRTRDLVSETNYADPKVFGV